MVLAGEAAAVIETGFQIPALVVVRAGILPCERSLAGGNHGDEGLVEVRVADRKTGIIGPGSILIGVVQATAAGALLCHLHRGVIAALHAGTEAFRDEIQLLVDGEVHSQGGLVLVGVTRHVVILPTVPLGKTLRQGVGGNAGECLAGKHTGAAHGVGPQHRQGPDVVPVGIRLLGIADNTADVEVHVGGFGEFEVQVCAVVVTVVCVVVVVVHARDLLEQTILEHVTQRHKVTHLVRTAGDVDVVLGLEEGLAEHHLIPVGAGVHDGVAVRAIGFDCLRSEVVDILFHIVVPLEHVVVACEVVCATLFDVGHRHLHTGDGAHRNLRLAGITALCGDDDDAVSTTHTEHGGGGGVLEDGQALDFIRVDGVQGALDAIHEDERA